MEEDESGDRGRGWGRLLNIKNEKRKQLKAFPYNM